MQRSHRIVTAAVVVAGLLLLVGFVSVAWASKGWECNTSHQDACYVAGHQGQNHVCLSNSWQNSCLDNSNPNNPVHKPYFAVKYFFVPSHKCTKTHSNPNHLCCVDNVAPIEAGPICGSATYFEFQACQGREQCVDVLHTRLCWNAFDCEN